MQSGKVTAHDLRRLAVEAVCAERTARRWCNNPLTVSENNRIRLERAALALGMELPLPQRSAA